MKIACGRGGVMRRWRATAVLVAWCLAAAVGAEPSAEADPPTADPPLPQTSGDVTRDQARPSGWTWFGMGYEERMRARTGGADGRPGNRGTRPAGQGRGGR